MDKRKALILLAVLVIACAIAISPAAAASKSANVKGYALLKTDTAVKSGYIVPYKKDKYLYGTVMGNDKAAIGVTSGISPKKSTRKYYEFNSLGATLVTVKGYKYAKFTGYNVKTKKYAVSKAIVPKYNENYGYIASLDLGGYNKEWNHNYIITKVTA
ncbi:MAG: hypothetical protein ACRC1M_00100, partial [Methanobacteriaceae archaeon]